MYRTWGLEWTICSSNQRWGAFARSGNATGFWLLNAVTRDDSSFPYGLVFILGNFRERSRARGFGTNRGCRLWSRPCSSSDQAAKEIPRTMSLLEVEAEGKLTAKAPVVGYPDGSSELHSLPLRGASG